MNSVFRQIHAFRSSNAVITGQDSSYSKCKVMLLFFSKGEAAEVIELDLTPFKENLRSRADQGCEKVPY